jgi:hypothetical protein
MSQWKAPNVSKTHLNVLEITEDDKRPHIILEYKKARINVIRLRGG